MKQGRLASVDFFKETKEDRKYFITKGPTKEDIAKEPKWGESFNKLLQEFEISLVKQALHEAKGNIASAARICGLMRTCLQTKCNKYGLYAEMFKDWS